MTCAPSGNGSRACAIRVILSPCTITTPFGITRPVPSTTEPKRSALVCAPSDEAASKPSAPDSPRTTRVRARSFLNNKWSGLADELYDFGENRLRVTELMYNPAPPLPTR